MKEDCWFGVRERKPKSICERNRVGWGHIAEGKNKFTKREEGN